MAHHARHRAATAALLLTLAGFAACGKTTHIDKPNAAPTTQDTSASTSAPAGATATADEPAIGSTTADLTAAIDGVDSDLKAGDTEVASANTGLTQDEGDPTK